MNHLGDTNKMVDTPRTDAAKKIVLGGVGCDWEVVHIAFSRQLERELNAANQIAKKYEDRYFAANERIKRLEEALYLVRPHCSFVHHSKKHQHAYDEPCPVVALIEKAKEAKL